MVAAIWAQSSLPLNFLASKLVFPSILIEKASTPEYQAEEK